ncbi:MAG: alkaline phosphatase family protein [Betaproteobacteria bacterium]
MANINSPNPDAANTTIETDTPPRREFLKASAVAAGATLLASCGGGGETAAAFDEAIDDPLTRFDHLVCVMFENRSMDNLLGYLYPKGSAFNGLFTGDYTNPVPDFINDGHLSVSARPSPGTDADMQNPNPDPGEGYPHINTQLFGTVDPATNAFFPSGEMQAPYNLSTPAKPAAMQGFVHDYCNNFRRQKNRNPTFEEYRVIMDSFTPAQLPVLSTLAQSFAVYDAWFSAVPSQTYCNRAFFHASTSSGYVLNAPHKKWLENNLAPTIFNRLQDADRTWRIYFDESQLVSLTGLIHVARLLPYWKSNFRFMTDFYADVAAGNLPDYAFIEPRMMFNHNDFHPPGPLIVDGLKVPDPSDVRAGDLLLHNIYTAIKASGAPAPGSSALNTLLLVTFDEHGGCYDHVVPPSAPTPDLLQPAGEQDFYFDRLGLRVPTIAISAHTPANTIVSYPVNHAALVRTLCRKYKLPHLTNRDIDAQDLRDAVSQAAVRDPSTWPVTVPRPVPPDAQLSDPTVPPLSKQPLNDLERNIYALAMTHFTGVEVTDDGIPDTLGEAYAMLQPRAKGAFGPGNG